MGILVIFI